MKAHLILATMIATLMILQDSVHAFRIAATEGPHSGLPPKCAPPGADDQESARRGIYGQALHEQMTQMSVDLARKRLLVCNSTPTEIDAYLKPATVSQLTALACCRYVKGSRECACLNNQVRTDRFLDPNPIITGSRWPDDPCHLLARGDTFHIPAHWWAVGRRAGNNLFFLSHFHDFAFFHSMAASPDNQAKSNEKTEVTQQKILTWAEFAFKVADGTIPSWANFPEASEALSPGAKEQLIRMFPGFMMGKKQWSVDFLFTGLVGADEAHVRQVALGALLHTIQDAFSDSHVRRFARGSSPAPLANPGVVVQFLDYKQQDRFVSHPKADNAPPDLAKPPSDLKTIHPVTLGAELIGCAVARTTQSSSESMWPKVRDLILPLYELDKTAEPKTGRGNY